MGVGFGEEPFGDFPFGDCDWAYEVLYRSLPDRLIQQDRDAGGYYEKFVRACAVPMNRLRSLVNDVASLGDPLKMRLDLLRFYSKCFGLETDTAEPEVFQRTSADLFARFRLIKGTTAAAIVLARIHGFECSIQELWFDGTNYTSTPPSVTGEVIGLVP